MTINTAVVFIRSNYNKYSLSALAGAIESVPETKKTSLYFVSTRRAKKPDLVLDEIRSLQNKYDKLLVCFSFATTNIVEVHELLSVLRSSDNGLDKPGLLYVAGGPHATGDPEETLHLGFDVVAIGEAEEGFPQLVEAISNGLDYREIKGLAYMQDNAVIKTGKRKLVDLDNFAPYSVKHNLLSPIEISRGCPHACRFCQTSFMSGGMMRHRSVENILKYIELAKSNGTKDFRFISPNALAYGSRDGKTVNLVAIESLLRESSKTTGKNHLFFGSFPSEVRPESVSQETLELITGYTATKQLVIGTQTGSQRMLDILHRQHSVEDIYRAVRLTLKAGLNVCVDFIFGLPEENKVDRELSIKMIDELASLGAKIHSHTFIPLPGTPLAQSEAGVVDDDLAKYLSRLANKGLQFGQWQKQQALADKTTRFRSDKYVELR